MNWISGITAAAVALLSASFLIDAFTSRPAMAQAPPCGPRASIVTVLDTRYEESMRAVGLISGSLVLEIFVSEAGTWTALTTNRHGLSCVVATGQAWQDVPAVERDPGVGS